MKSYYFNALRTSDLATYPTGYDRVYDATDRADYHAAEATDGIFATASNACEVYVISGLTLGVREGYAQYRGYRAHVEGDETIAVNGNCTICLRWNNTEAVRAFELVAVTSLIRTDVIYDLPLATVTVSGSTAKVKDARVWSRWTRLPAYYPPDTDEVPLSLWRYIMGLPMTDDEIAAVEGNASLMEIYHNTRPYLAGRYGLKYVSSASSGAASNATGEEVTRYADLTADYDATGMLGADGTTLTIPAGVSRVAVTMLARGTNTTMIGSGEGYVAIIHNGTEVYRKSNSIPSSDDWPEFEIFAVVDVAEGDTLAVRLYARAGSGYAAAAYVDSFRLEVVE